MQPISQGLIKEVSDWKKDDLLTWSINKVFLCLALNEWSLC